MIAWRLASPSLVKHPQPSLGVNVAPKIFTPLVRARSIICLWIAMMSSAVGVGFCRALLMSLMPSSTMTCVTPLCPSASRSNRASALTPALKAASLNTRLPPMPALSTPILALPGCAIKRSARRSGQRLFMSGVDAAPSVIESPKATIAPACSGAITSTRVRRNHDCVVATTGNAGMPA